MTRPARQPRPELDPEWKRWLAENLLLGVPADAVAAELAAKGCPPDIALAEIAEAEASPYFRGAAVLRARLAKRDWHLTQIARHEVLAAPVPVPVRHRLNADTFLAEYYAPQRPVKLTGLADHWPATGWTPDRIAALAGDPEVEVQHGRERDADYELNSAKLKARVRLSTLLAAMRAGDASNDIYLTANNSGHNRAALAPLWAELGDIPGYLPAEGVAAGFLWMGPRGTVTPWHHDLTNNLLMQVWGTKRVRLVSSAQVGLMRNHRHCFSQFGGDATFADVPQAERPRVLEVELGPGEILFIPVGWWHHVVGETATIGLSFTALAWPNAPYEGYTTYDQV